MESRQFLDFRQQNVYGLSHIRDIVLHLLFFLFQLQLLFAVLIHNFLSVSPIFFGYMFSVLCDFFAFFVWCAAFLSLEINISNIRSNFDFGHQKAWYTFTHLEPKMRKKRMKKITHPTNSITKKIIYWNRFEKSIWPYLLPDIYKKKSIIREFLLFLKSDFLFSSQDMATELQLSFLSFNSSTIATNSWKLFIFPQINRFCGLTYPLVTTCLCRSAICKKVHFSNTFPFVY